MRGGYPYLKIETLLKGTVLQYLGIDIGLIQTQFSCHVDMTRVAAW